MRIPCISKLPLAICPGVVCLALVSPAHAQYRFDHWTADNGLPQNSVRDIVQTRDGYLWLTTFDGLVRFDGVRFTVFNKSNSPQTGRRREFVGRHLRQRIGAFQGRTLHALHDEGRFV